MKIDVHCLGDCNPLDYDGFFLLVRSGEGSEDYSREECIVIEPLNPDEQDEKKQAFEVYRFCPELCYFEKDPNSGFQCVLSDNEYHKDSPAWFAENILDYREDFDSWIDDITSDNPVLRSLAYQEIGYYHGFENLDNYPLRFEGRNAITEWLNHPAYGLGKYAD